MDRDEASAVLGTFICCFVAVAVCLPLYDITVAHWSTKEASAPPSPTVAKLLVIGEHTVITEDDTLTVWTTKARRPGTKLFVVDGTPRWAHHITNTDPNYLGLGKMQVTGYAEDGSVIWSINDVTKVEMP